MVNRTRYHTDNSYRKYSRQKSRASPLVHDRDHGHHRSEEGARLKGNHDEWKRLKGAQKWTSNIFKLVDEAESGFRKNNLRPAYRAIKRLRGSKRSNANGSVARSDGSLCNTPAEITERWREHYQNTQPFKCYSLS